MEANYRFYYTSSDRLVSLVSPHSVHCLRGIDFSVAYTGEHVPVAKDGAERRLSFDYVATRSPSN